MKTLARLLCLAAAAALPAIAEEPVEKAPAPDYKITGPQAHKNLSVFLIHGKDRIQGKEFLTLQEALEQKLVVVHETGNVQELSAENLSKDKLVFIMAGDIVKGGQQDRTLQYDLVLAAQSGKVPLPSFCVEQGRWAQRGGEKAGQFSSSANALATRELQLANRYANDQGKVWAEVAKTQKALSDQVGEKVGAEQSATSLQLALENKKLKEAIAEYTTALAKLPEGSDDIIGVAFAVNGKVSTADVYAAGGLFRKLWPKLLEAAATEAVAGFKPEAKTEPVKAEAVSRFLAEAKQGKASEKKLSPAAKMITRDSKDQVLFETRDTSGEGMPAVRENYLAK